jgi:Flp pilus assembly protein TadD
VIPAITIAAVFGAMVLSGCDRRVEPTRPRAPEPRRVPTFNRDIAPILYAHCATCHRAGQVAGFPLLTYDDARSRAATIARVTRARTMPPWLADVNEPPFVGERRLGDEAIETLSRWAEAGAPEGNPADAVAAPVVAGGWQLGEPDLVVGMPKPYELRPGAHDVFRNFVIPVAQPIDRFVRALEFRSENGAVVHHAVIGIDRTRMSRRRDGSNGEPGYDGMFSQGTENPAGHFLGWTPGRGPLVAPAGMSWRLERGADFVVQLHLLPRAAPEPVQAKVGLYFSDQPPSRVPILIKLGSKAIDIPAGDTSYAITDSYTLPVDVDLLSVYPHAHYLAREMVATATLPDGTVTQLLRIRAWDFHWQQDYRYVTPIVLPRGATLRMRYTYDNSRGNRHNTHDPPREVTFGPQSHDEMGDLWLQVLPRNSGDAALLSRAFSERETIANIAGGEMLVRRFPTSARHRAFLGDSYVDAGRVHEAITQLQEAIRFEPGLADAQNALGRALIVSGRPRDAIRHFRAAVASDPSDDRLRFNLAGALELTGATGDAMVELQRTVDLNPEFAEAHSNLGVLLGRQGRFAAAIPHLERAVHLSPDYADAHLSLGATLASVGQIDRAVTHLRHALDLRPDDRRAAEYLRRLFERQP